MKPGALIFIVLSIIMIFFIAAKLFSKGKYLKTERMEDREIRGVYTLIFYGANEPGRAVIFDPEDDVYTIKMNESKHNYTTRRNVPADKAVKEAVAFIASQRFSMRKVIDEGRIVGYDMRPEYEAVRYGSSDILDINYRLSDRTVSVTVGIKSSIRKRFNAERFGGN